MPSKLEQMQLQFRQKLMQEKEERLIKIHTDNQQKALSQVAKHNGIPATRTTNLTTVSKPPMMMMMAAAPHHPHQSHHSSPVKKGSPGVDRSRPLPPIAKEPKKGPPGHSRISPVSAPVDNGLKFASGNGVRSKSVELEPRQSPGRGYQNGRTQGRNGFARSAFEGESEKTSAVSEAQVQRKTEQDALAKLRQAELQRLRGNSKVEDTSPRNGYATYAVPKSSSNDKKLVSTNRTQATPRYEPPRTNKVAPKRPSPVAATGHRTQAAAANGGRRPPGPGQEQCAVCGRNFNTDRIDKHRPICSKAAKKKVKVFDATKMRVQGTEAEKYVRKGLPKTVPKPKNSNWRKQHEEFIEAIRQAKLVQQHVAAGGKVSDLPPPPPSDTSHYVPCPHCGRRFNEGVAERHIPKCKNISCNKKAPLPRRK